MICSPTRRADHIKPGDIQPLNNTLGRPVLFLDTNILSHACSASGEAVIARLNTELNTIYPQQSLDTSTTFMFTPFSLIENLGITWPEIPNVLARVSMSKDRSAGEIVSDVIAEAKLEYRKIPNLQPQALKARAEDRRRHICPASTTLFDICVGNKAASSDASEAIVSCLAFDYATKVQYPKSIEVEVDRFHRARALAQPRLNTMTTFRITKRYWDLFYTRGRKFRNPDHLEEIELVNRSMRLKTTRDFVDCEIIYFACFGWGDAPVAAITCDPPEALLHRIAVFKGFVENLNDFTDGIAEENLPRLNDGHILRCDPDGTVTHVFPTAEVPAIR